MSRRRFPLWLLLAAVVAVALLVGSGVFHSTPPTPAQRAASLESVVRCPTCEDLSVAQSSAPTAVAVRAAVDQLIAEGRSDQQIEAYLVARYGSSIVLDPPASGWSLLVWLLPLLGGLAATTGLVVVLLRRRRQPGGDPEGGDPGPALTPEMTEDRRNFLLRSLADADAEYLAGDLSDQDYLALRQRDMVRLSALEAQAGHQHVTAGVAAAPGRSSVALDDRVAEAELPGPRAADAEVVAEPDTGLQERPGPRRRGRRSWWFLGGAVVAFGAALIMAVTLFASNRQPGQAITGTFAQSQAQQLEATLAQAATDENQGQAGQAAQLYQSVLDKHPANEVALAQLGWLEYQTGVQGSSTSLITDARTKLNRAVRLDPADYAARLYLGTLLLQRDGNAPAAVAQYQRFLANGPPAALVAQAAPEIRDAFTKAGLPVPTAVGG